MSEIGQGDIAPRFEVPLEGGATFRLADHVGRLVVLFFYPKDDTSGCTAEALEFSALAPGFAAAGAVLLGISPDSAKSHAKFRAKHGLSMPLGADEAHGAIDAYGVWKEKSMYGRKYMGVERSTFLLGGDGRILHAWRKVSVPGHASEVLAAVKAAGT